MRRTARHERSNYALYITATVLRLGVFLTCPTLSEALLHRPELSTPISANKRLREGIFLYQRGLDPYVGGTFHQAPLLLPFFSILFSTWSSPVVGLAVNIVLDIISAESLIHISRSGAASSSSRFISSRKARVWSSSTVAAVFLFNPFTLASCLAQTTASITVTFTFLAVRYACDADILRTTFAIAVSTYLSLHPVLVLPALGLLCYDRSTRVEKPTRFACIFVGSFAVIAAFLLLSSRALLPSWQFLRSIYLTPLMLPDLLPNPGLWWYFFIEMFDTFREFFLAVFWLHMLAYSIPVCIRLQRQPLAAIAVVIGTVAVFQPYSNAGDAGAWLALLSIFGHTFELSSTHRNTFAASATLIYAALLGPAFHYLWITAGSGNANFFYAITLVWTLALLILLTDFVYAVLRDQWEVQRPDVKTKEARQI